MRDSAEDDSSSKIWQPKDRLSLHRDTMILFCKCGCDANWLPVELELWWSLPRNCCQVTESWELVRNMPHYCSQSPNVEILYWLLSSACGVPLMMPVTPSVFGALRPSTARG
ncbi:hypothetical protein LIA77_11159 [Sarocladium implicatum]|nr:hypothetical protein LIA77_11159 [Sarocladium implicatum]